jgi:hypothetical protein
MKKHVRCGGQGRRMATLLFLVEVLGAGWRVFGHFGVG